MRRVLSLLLLLLSVVFAGDSSAFAGKAGEKDLDFAMIELTGVWNIGSKQELSLIGNVDSEGWFMHTHSTEAGEIQVMSWKNQLKPGNVLQVRLGSAKVPADAVDQAATEELQKFLTGAKDVKIEPCSLKFGESEVSGSWYRGTLKDGRCAAGFSAVVDGQALRLGTVSESVKTASLVSVEEAAKSGLKCFVLKPRDPAISEGMWVKIQFGRSQIRFATPLNWSMFESKADTMSNYEGMRATFPEEMSSAEKKAGTAPPMRKIVLNIKKVGDTKLAALAGPELTELKSFKSNKVVNEKAALKPIPVNGTDTIQLNYVGTSDKQSIPTLVLLAVDNGALFRLTITCKPGTKDKELESEDIRGIVSSATFGF